MTIILNALKRYHFENKFAQHNWQQQRQYFKEVIDLDPCVMRMTYCNFVMDPGTRN